MSFRNVIHKLLNFCLANQKLQDSLNCKYCQRNLLITEVILKTSRLRVLNNEFYLLHSKFDFAYVFSPFLSSNDVILKSHDSIQQKTFSVLFKNRQPKHNTDGVILNYFKFSLSVVEKSLLAKGLWFS